MQAQMPNIILILTDQQRYDTLSCNGNSSISTPALDRLAAEGVCLDNTFVQCPMCTPSRAALATGRYPSTNRTRWNGVPFPPGETTFMELLQERGYHTALFGKLHLLPHTLRRRSDPTYGFQTALMAEHPRPHWASEYSDWLDAHFPEHRLERRKATYSDELQVWVPDLPPEAHMTTWVTDRTLEFLRKAPSEPFFVQMGFYDPHHPFDPPDPYASMFDPADVPLPVRRAGELEDKPPHFLDGHLGKFNPIMGFLDPHVKGAPAAPQPDFSQVSESMWRRLIAHYYGMVALIDTQVGRVMSTLQETGLDQNTLVLFTSDHGELLGDHGFLFKGPYHYDSVLRVPTIARWPRGIARGTRSSELVELIDLAPTILEAAGIAPPAGMQGRSLLPLLRNPALPGRESVLVERNDAYWRLNMKTFRTERWKLTYYQGKPYGELYDLAHDPHEFVNLWDDPGYARVRNEMIGGLLDRLVAAEDELPLRTALT